MFLLLCLIIDKVQINENKNMNYEDKKIVGVVASNVEPEVALNVIGHLAISIGKYSNEEIMGK